MKDGIKDGKDGFIGSTGKFENAEQLLSAYNALESEFTKRCQLLKQLQAELDGLRAQAENEGSAAIGQDGGSSDGDGETLVVSVEPPAEPAPAPGDDASIALDVADEVLRHADEYAEVLAAVPEIMNACIARYKKKLLDARIGFVSPSGAAVIMPAARPKTLSDAKRLADDLLNL